MSDNLPQVTEDEHRFELRSFEPPVVPSVWTSVVSYFHKAQNPSEYLNLVQVLRSLERLKLHFFLSYKKSLELFHGTLGMSDTVSKATPSSSASQKMPLGVYLYVVCGAFPHTSGTAG